MAKDILVENSIKPVLSKIAEDIQTKTTITEVGNYMEEHSTDIPTVDLTTVLNNYYTKAEVLALIEEVLNGGSGGGSSTISVSSVSLNSSTVSINMGSTVQLTATVLPVDATNKTIVWTTSNNSIATVSNGLVTPLSEGTAVITVSTVDGNYTDTCTVTVIASTQVLTGTSDHISTSKLDLNGLDKTMFDDSSNSLYDNRVLFFADDFEGDTLDSALYSVSSRREPNFKVTAWTPEKVTVHDSMVTFAGAKEDVVLNGTTYPYHCGEMVTNLHFQNCLFEAKIRHDKKSNWCDAYWTCGYNVDGFQNWAYCGEIDVFEEINGQKTSTLHFATATSNHSNAVTTRTIDASVLTSYRNSGNTEDWHIYGCEMRSGKITLYFDHQPFYEYDTTSINHYEGVNPFNYWQHFIFSVASWSNSAEGTAYMDMDWIRAWSLEDETASDLIPQSVQIQYLGTANRIEAQDKIKTGTIVQFVPTYVPSTVPVAADINTTGYETFETSDGILTENGGAIRFIGEGNASVTYTDVIGTTYTKQYTGYASTLPDGEIALEGFNALTAPCKYGKYNSLSTGQTLAQATWQAGNEKSLCFGVYSVLPSTTYSLSFSGRHYSETIRISQLDSNKQAIASANTSLSSATSFTTSENTRYVLVQFVLASSLVLNDYLRIHEVFKTSFAPVFTKESSNEIPCTAITTDSSISVTDNDSISYTLTPNNTTDTVSFLSSDTSVLTVDSTGNITVIATGNATITITCGSISETISVAATKTSAPPSPPVSYSLPSDFDTVKYINADILLSETFTNQVLVHDEVNDKYYFIISKLPYDVIEYNSTKSCVAIGNSSKQTEIMIMVSDSATLPDCVDYWAHYSDGRIKKTNAQVSSTQKHFFEVDVENNIDAITSVSDIEVLYANYNIAGFYTVA